MVCILVQVRMHNGSSSVACVVRDVPNQVPEFWSVVFSEVQEMATLDG